MWIYHIFQRRQWQPTPVLLPGKSHGQRSLVGYSPWGLKELDTIEWLHLHFSLSCIGEGNGDPPQRSCLENPRDGGAWWAAVYGVTQSQTRLKWLSSSSKDCSLPGSSVHAILQAKYCSGLPFPSPGYLPDADMKPGFPALQADSLLSEPRAQSQGVQ